VPKTPDVDRKAERPIRDRPPLADEARNLYRSGDNDAALALALKIDEVVKQKRQADWRGVTAREQMLKQELFKVIGNIDEVNRLFPIIFAQKGEY